jgi:hypothetical protein
MTDEEKKAAEEKAAAEADAAFNAKLNAAVASHTKRLKAEFEKQLADTLAKLSPAREEKPADKPADGSPGAAKADPEVIKLREQLDKLTRQADEDRKARAAVEEKSRRENARTSIREALAAKGITGARARAVIADLEASNAVRFTEDGVPELVIKRARMKGSRAEELAFDDLAAGIEDWSKSDDAKEFLPATTVQTAAPRRAGSATTSPARASSAATSHDRALTDDERAEAAAKHLEANGLDVASLFD